MSKIRELEQQIANIKKEESKEAWRIWHKEGKDFLNNIVGKCFLSLGHKDSFMMFKVLKYEVQGVWEITDHPGYYIIHTEGYFTVNKANWSSKIDINNSNGSPYGTFSLINTSKNSKTTDVSALQYKEQSLKNSCSVSDNRIVTIGRFNVPKKENNFKIDYDTWICNQPKPETSVQNEFFGLFIYECPEEFYNEAKQIVDKLKIDTFNLWKKYQTTLDTVKRYGE